jgi:hypothetical protein
VPVQRQPKDHSFMENQSYQLSKILYMEDTASMDDGVHHPLKILLL